ncbi:hypothetical protein GOFOIKOB_5640 [Methylobacterium tardum]|uniref:Uncharacterized protein n=1 Tax=Methylobacterium tardum TaxID=374432 RepID=A0AA37TT34_9HYPH|nr:hypothetical protein GOFOIKOB_5640 [Methylobacterium tardum]GLS73758.1 hypothetical protein GCM10007890_57730 [Methylobacterium tardum]
MTTLHSPSRAWSGEPLVQDAVAEYAKLAASYSIAASNLADAGDTPGMVHALGCAGRALLAAQEAVASLRSVEGGGR